MARSPVIALTGGPTPRSHYRNFYQEVEDFTQFDPVTKFNARVEDPGTVAGSAAAGLSNCNIGLARADAPAIAGRAGRWP